MVNDDQGVICLVSLLNDRCTHNPDNSTKRKNANNNHAI